jgi:predicted Zn-dependent peptidase
VSQEHSLTTLGSGVRVVTETMPAVRSVAIGFWIGTGSRGESDEQAGLSHLLEHLLFKGSSRYSGVQIAQVFDGLGGELNAATAKEYTVLYARVLDAHLETALDVMGDMLLAPTFDADELDSEREVVLEEIAMYEDSFHDLAHDLIAGAVFGDHPLGRPVMGESSPQTVFQAKASEQYHVCLAGLGLQRSDRRRFAASLLDSMLGGSASSRLFQEIRERRGMAYSVYTFGSQYADTGMVGVYVGTREDNVAECMRITADQLVRMGQGEFADDELQRSKENLKGRIMLSMESTSNRASRLGKSVLTDTELLSLDRICAEIDSVEPEAVASLARQLFAPDRLSVSGVGPDEDRFREAVAALNPALA